MAQTKTPQRTPAERAARTGMNREQARRGLSATAPSGRSAAPLAAGGARGGRRGGSIIGFIRETRAELRKVVWPTQRETMNLTAVVIGLSVAVGLFLGAVDFLFQELFRIVLSASGNGGF